MNFFYLRIFPLLYAAGQRSPLPLEVPDFTAVVIHVGSRTAVVGPRLAVRVRASHAAVRFDSRVPRGPLLGVETVNSCVPRRVSLPAIAAAGLPIVLAPTRAPLVPRRPGTRVRASHAAVRLDVAQPPRPRLGIETLSLRVSHGVGAPPIGTPGSPIVLALTLGRRDPGEEQNECDA
jgi:hypothetical protein